MATCAPLTDFALFAQTLTWAPLTEPLEDARPKAQPLISELPLLNHQSHVQLALAQAEKAITEIIASNFFISILSLFDIYYTRGFIF